MVDDAGGTFVLVHVATPIDECERTDRKGLYAMARAGRIPTFTGVSDPYQEPADAELTIDTTTLDIDDAAEQLFHSLARTGLVTATCMTVDVAGG